jgi:(+)-trans-carveol dehydrogenase
VGRLNGKVACVTGAARGQGRSHAVRLAEEGAAVIAIDICRQIESSPIPGATREDLDETCRLVAAHGVQVRGVEADVRNLAAVEEALRDGVEAFQRLDVVCVNAAMYVVAPTIDISPAEWRDTLEINLTGAWHTCRAAIPYLQAAGGGSIVITTSGATYKTAPNFAHYTASKYGLTALMKTLANEHGRDWIRVNCVAPTACDTMMMHNEMTYRTFRPDLESPTREDVEGVAVEMHALPVPWVEPIDISNAVAFLVSDEARYITGVTLPVDLGLGVR